MKSKVGAVMRGIGWAIVGLGALAWVVLLSMSHEYHSDISVGTAFIVLAACAVSGAFFMALGEIIRLLRDCLSRLNQMLGLPDELVTEEADEEKTDETVNSEESKENDVISPEK